MLSDNALSPPRRPLKIILLGEGRCGKTSILLRFAKNEFNAGQAPTTMSSFLEKRIVVEGTPVTLAIWDTAGQEKYHALGPIFYRDADAAILVFDQTEPSSFEKVQVWMKELRVMVQDEIPICIAGNKSDLTRKIDVEVVQAYGDQVAARVFWTSALLNKEIDEMFGYLTRTILATRQAQDSKNKEKQDAPSQPSLMLLQQPVKKEESQENCC